MNYTMSSACATSGHCIGNASELIQLENKTLFLQEEVMNYILL